MIEGIESSDVGACVKHFAVNNQETERNWVNVEIDERTLREIYLPAFEAAVKKAVDEQLETDAVKAQITEGIAKAKAGRESLENLKTQLDSYNEFYTGLLEYTAGVSTAAAGADKLNSGAAAL